MRIFQQYNTTISKTDVLDQDGIDTKSNEYINMQLSLPRGHDNEMEFVKVRHRIFDKDNLPIGKPDANPFLDYLQYQGEYLDGTLKMLSTNIIAENLIS